MDFKEMRKWPRYPMEQIVAVNHATGATAGIGLNLSASGLYFSFGSKLACGSRIELLLPTPSSGILRCKCKVVRVDPDRPPGRFGVAVAFENVEILPNTQTQEMDATVKTFAASEGNA